MWKHMLLSPNKATSVTLEYVYLYNFLRAIKISRKSYTPQGSLDFNNESGEITPRTREHVQQ